MIGAMVGGVILGYRFAADQRHAAELLRTMVYLIGCFEDFRIRRMCRHDIVCYSAINAILLI